MWAEGWGRAGPREMVWGSLTQPHSDPSPLQLHWQLGSASPRTMKSGVCPSWRATVGMMWQHLFYSPLYFLILHFVLTVQLPATGQSWQTGRKTGWDRQVLSYKLDLYHVLSFERYLFINGCIGRNRVGRNMLCKQASNYWHFRFLLSNLLQSCGSVR